MSGQAWQPRLFSGRESAGFRLRRLAFLALYLGVFLAVTVPVVPALWNGPSLFGLPRAFVWVVFNLFLMFFALLGLYWSDETRGARSSGSGTSGAAIGTGATVSKAGG